MTTTADDPSLQLDHFIAEVSEDHETSCWGCGLRLLLPSYSAVFKCGWCGAITNQNSIKRDNKCFRWRRLRDRTFVCILLVFMLFVIGGGVWAMHPVIFSMNYFGGVFHSIIIVILSISTLSMFSLSSFRCAGEPPKILWGSFPAVGKGIGNCVGARNHRHFIGFLISAVISTTYVAIFSLYAGLHIWSLEYKPHGLVKAINKASTFVVIREVSFALLSSALYLSVRGVVLIYLFFASASVNIGLSVLLWQQLSYIYEGKTYVERLSSKDESAGKKDCQNLVHFFGCSYSISRYLSNFTNSRKIHKK
ncbi:hypothetical protein ACFE04_013594 [Oxalis oulophora]